MKRLKPYTDDIIAAIGAVLVSVGVFMIYAPAGIISAGVLLIVSATAIAKGGGMK